MNGGLRDIALAIALEVVPAALFGASIGLAALIAAGQPVAVAAPAAAAAFLLASTGLRRMGAGDVPIVLPQFEIGEFEPEISGDEELLLEDVIAGAERDDELLLEDRITGPASDDDELLLDELLAGSAPDSRVIPMFDSQAVPTAGELRERIDRHLGCGPRPAAPPDATRELHEALNELRRSLR